MKKKRIQRNIVPAIVTTAMMAWLVGCSHVDAVTLEAFAMDLLRNAAAAFLL